MDRLVESDLSICAQIYLPIEHCLISQSPLEQVVEVRSKDKAIGQCRSWLAANLPGVPIMDVVSTAEAVRSTSQDPKIAAVVVRSRPEIRGSCPGAGHSGSRR